MTTETNLKALYIFRCLFTTSSVICSDCTDFCLQIFVYNCVFWKRKNNTHETFHILKMKAHFEKEPHFGNERSFWNPFWNKINATKNSIFFYFCYLPWNWVELFDKLSRPHKNYNFEALGDFILLWPQPMSNFYTKHSCYDTLTLEKSSPWKEMCIK